MAGAGGVYSTRLILGYGNGPFAYTPPSGKIAIVKQITAANTGGQTAQLNAYMDGVNIWYASIPGKSCAVSQGLFVVVPELVSFYLATDGVAMSLHASGYVLAK
jgi:hypothetical protein